MAVTANQYNVSKQTIRNQTIKVELLDFDLRTVGELSGNVIEGNVSIDANADIRRTCEVSCVVTDSSFDVKSGSKIWLDKYIRLLVGIDELFSGEITWFNYGIYLINAPTWSYDAENNTLTFEGLDLTAKMTGERNGYLEGIPVIIPQGSNVREAMISTITQLGGFNQYIIDECRLKNGNIQDVPYDMTFEQGSTVWDVIVALRDIMPRYECFFDVDGVFIYQQIPTGDNETSVADDDVFKDNLLSEEIANDFSYVKNYVEVYGAVKEPSYYSEDVTLIKRTYKVTIPDFMEYGDGGLYGFTWDGNITPVTPYTKGDVNGDGEITEEDVQLLQDYILHRVTLSPEAIEAGDMNNSGSITLTDLVNLEQYRLSASIQVNNLEAIPLLNEDGTYPTIEPNVYYVFMYRAPQEEGQQGRMIFLGGVQATGIAKDEDENSPFNINGTVGRIRMVCAGDEYDTIMSDTLAQERADYELWLHTRMQDGIVMDLVPVHYLDVNQVVSHKARGLSEEKQYIIKTISVDLGEEGTQSVEAISYYPLYAPEPTPTPPEPTFRATIIVNTRPNVIVEAVSGNQYYTASSNDSGVATVIVKDSGLYTITTYAEDFYASDFVNVTTDGSTYTIQVGEALGVIVAHATSGSTVYCTKDSMRMDTQEVDGTWTFTMYVSGDWVVTAEYEGNTDSETVNVVSGMGTVDVYLLSPIIAEIKAIQNAALGSNVTFDDKNWLLVDKTATEAVLAYPNIYSKVQYGSVRSTYANSTLRSACTSFMNDELTEDAIRYINDTTILGVTDKVFVPTREQCGTAPFGWYTTSEHRIAQYNGNPTIWWLSTYGDTTASFISVGGGLSTSTGKTISYGFRPHIKITLSV